MQRILFGLCFLLSLPALSQSDGWDVYLARFDKGPGSVLVDMSLLDRAPVKNLRAVVVTGVGFKNCNSEGLPEQDELTKLYRVSDSVEALIKHRGAYQLAGTFTYQCERLDYFYVTDTVQLRKKLLSLYKTRFPEYKPSITIRLDTAWTLYRKFLYPSETIYEYMQNEKVLMALQKAGDSLTKARVVDHFFYFKTKEARSSFWIYASTYGFKLESQENTADPDFPCKLHVSRMDKVDLKSISEVTIVLRKEARKYGGKYDGWETVLVRK